MTPNQQPMAREEIENIMQAIKSLWPHYAAVKDEAERMLNLIEVAKGEQGLMLVLAALVIKGLLLDFGPNKESCANQRNSE